MLLLTLAIFKELLLHDLVQIENCFSLNVNVYVLEWKEQAVAKILQRSRYLFSSTINLNLYENHFSYIKSMQLYTGRYVCPRCSKIWTENNHYHRHIRTCEFEVKHKYVGGVYHTPLTIFERLDEVGIHVPEEDRYFPFRATFDFEAYFSKRNLPEGTDLLQWNAKHVPLSVSVASNVPGFLKPLCIINEKGVEEMQQKMLEYLEEISHHSYKFLSQKFYYVFSFLEKSENEYLLEPFQSYLKELPVVGFNSGRYDLCLIKEPFLTLFHPNIEFTVEKNNNYVCIKSSNLKFLDMVNYIAPGFSYQNFIKAFGVKENKFFFPYEWLDSPDKLDYPDVPPHGSFYSSLKQANITDKEYAFVVSTWQEKNWKSVRDMLVYYNNCDVVPFLEAIEKQFLFYKSKKLDLFKDGMTVPGLTLKYLFSTVNPGIHFTVIDSQNQDLHQLIKDNITGGPSIIFCRYQEANVTKLRKLEYGHEANICKSIQGNDANALYLWAIMQGMPTSYFIRYKETNNFKPVVSHKYGHLAREWLEWLIFSENISIKHMFNGKEKRLGPRQLPVDGFCQQTKTVYQLHGCYWHGHLCHLNRDKQGNFKVENLSNGKTMSELQAETRKNTEYLKDLGYKVTEIYECQWRKMKSSDPKVKAFLQNFNFLKPIYGMNEQILLSAIQNDKIFGMVLCDIKTPEHLKPYFSEFCPIFKNVEVGREDIGDLMERFAVDNNLLPKPQKMLIGSYFADKILLITPLLKWYINHGLEVTKIYEVVQYLPVKCFENFGLQVSEARRSGDSDPNKAVLAQTFKLWGNSSYGKTICNKEKHKNIRYCDSKAVSELINDPLFHKLNTISEDLYEIEHFKKKIVLDLPIQIGFFVYGYAKLRMLEFYYDFLDFYINRQDFECCEMDTDSLYYALSSSNLEDVIKPEKKEEFYENYHKWLPAQACPSHKEEFVSKKSQGLPFDPHSCCVKQQNFDKRSPGLFKLEWEGAGFIGLCSKTYFGFGVKDKQVSKGVNIKQNQFNKTTYLNVLKSQKSATGMNISFRVKDNSVYTYQQTKRALSYFYPKRKVLADGISTAPLEL